MIKVNACRKERCEEGRKEGRKIRGDSSTAPPHGYATEGRIATLSI